MQKKIADFHFAHIETSEIAKMVGKSEKVVERYIRDPLVQKYLRKKHDELGREILDRQYIEALKVREEILKNGKENNRLLAANAIIREKMEMEDKDNTVTVVFKGGFELGTPSSAEDAI